MATLYLNVSERFQVQQLLPATGAVTMLRQFRTFADTLSLTEGEQKEVNFVLHHDSTGSWSGPAALVRKPFLISETVLHELITVCKKLDTEARFPLACLLLWEQIVEGKIPDNVKTEVCVASNNGTD